MGYKLSPTFIVEFDKDTERIFKNREEGKNEMDVIFRLSRQRNDRTASLRNVKGVVLFVRTIAKDLFAVNVELKKQGGLEGVGKEPLKDWDVSFRKHMR